MSRAHSKFKTVILAAASASAILLSAQTAHAQCTPAAPVPGDTVTCLPGTYTGGLAWAVDDLTIVIGDAVTPTSVTHASGNGIEIVNASGSVDVQVSHPGSYIYGYSAGIYVGGSGSTVDINMNIEGHVAGADGIWVSSPVSGSAYIHVSDVTALNGTGMFVDVAGGSLTLLSTGTVTSTSTGIYAVLSATGPSSLQVADVTAGGAGVRVVADHYTSDLYISGSGNISGTNVGIYARNNGAGVLSVVRSGAAYSVTASSGTAIALYGQQYNTGVYLDVEGSVSGQSTGVRVNNTGSGGTDVNVADVTAASGTALTIQTGSTTTSVNVTGNGNITGTNQGIRVIHSGTGLLSVVRGGAGYSSTTASTGEGINLITGTNAAGIYLNVAGYVYGRQHGVDITGNNTSGDITAYLTGTVSSYSMDAIYIRNVASSTGNINLTAGVVTSISGRLITIDQNGTGGIYASVNNAQGNSASAAIDLRAASNSGNVDLDVTGTVRGHQGVVVINSAGTARTTDLNITDAEGLTFQGVYVDIADAGGSENLSITSSGLISGATDAIFIDHNAAGTTTLNVNDVLASNGRGIRVEQSGGDVSITATGNITSTNYAINVINQGTGSTYVSVSSITNAASGRIANIFNSNTTTDLAFVAAPGSHLYGFANGIFLDQAGSGDVYVSVNNVTTSNGTALRVNTNTASYGLDLSASGTLTSTNGYGLDISHNGSGPAVITAAAISGRQGARVNGGTTSGNITLSVSGDIYASNGTAFTHLGGGGVNDIDMVNVYSPNSRALFVNGRGTTTLDITGAVSGRDANTISGQTGDMTVNLGDVASTNNIGLYLRNQSSAGTFNLTSAGTVSGVLGIRALSDASYDMTISVVDVYGTTNQAVYLRNSGAGTGTLTFSTTGILVSDHYGLEARNYAVAADIYINAGDVTSNTRDGVSLRTNTSMTGQLSLTSTGTITAQDEGVFALMRGSGDLSINTYNIVANNRGLTLETTSNVAGNIYANNTGLISAANDGVRASVSGSGIVQVSTNDVTSTSRDGIYAITGSAFSGQAVFTSTGLIDASRHGIFARIFGSGDVHIAAADINAGTGNGIYVRAESTASGNVSITGTGSLYSTSSEAVEINHFGNGEIFVSLADASSGTSGAPVLINSTNASGGVYVLTSGTIAGTIDVNVNDVTRTTYDTDIAVEVLAATGDVDVTVTGDVEGSRFGIRTSSQYGSAITLSSGSTITGDNAAIRTQGVSAADVITLDGATINGRILTTQGNDIINFNTDSRIGINGDVDLGTQDDIFNLNEDRGRIQGVIYGGLGVDTFNVNQSNLSWFGTGALGDQIRQFEIINFAGTSNILFGRQFNYDEVNFLSGSETYLAQGARIYGDDITIESGAWVDLANNAFFNQANVQIDGTLVIAGNGDAGAAAILGVMNMGATGILMMDAPSSGSNDLLRVIGGAGFGWGEANLDGTLELSQGFALEEGEYTIINALNNLTGTFATVNGLGSGAGLTQLVEYDYGVNRVNIVTEVSAMAPEQTGSKSSASAANYLLGQIGYSSDYTALGFDVGNMASVAEIGDFAAGIIPDVLDSAVMVSDGAALRFGQSLAGCDMNFSLNAAESCAAVAGQDGPAMFGEIRQTSANTGTEVGHSFNAQSFDMTFGVRLTDSDDATQFVVMSGYSKSGSVSDAFGANPTTPLTPAQAGAQADSPWIPSFEGMSGGESGKRLADGLEAETFSFGGYARRDLGWWSLDGTAMVSTSEAKLVRNITPGLDIAEQAQSEFVSRQFNLQGTATLNGLGSSEFWIKPLATVGNRTLQRDGFTESGADLLGLTVEGQTRNVSYAGLGAEVSPDFTDEQGNGFRGLLRVTGLAYAGDTNSDFTARFTNAPGDSSFTYFGQSLDASVLLEGGFQYLAPNGFAIGAEGFGQVNPETGDSSTAGATLQLIKRW